MTTATDSSDELVRSAVELLAGLGLSAEIVAMDRAVAGVDAWIRLSTPQHARDYAVEARKMVAPGVAGLVQGHVGGRKTLIVARRVPEATAEVWRAKDIHFVDAAGNMYLRWPELIVDIRGRRRDTSAQAFVLPGRPHAAFKSAGLKVVFMYLSEPGTLNLPVRAAGEASGAAHGTVQNVLRELELTGYLDADRRRLHRTRELFNQWVEGYILNLWPKLTLGRFIAADAQWWRSSDEYLRQSDAQWGGETAAYRLKEKLRPGINTIYAPTLPRELILAKRLRRTEDQGNVEIRQRFWSFGEHSPQLTVPTPLIYADLIASTDPRQHEAAEDLRRGDEVLRRIDGG